MQVNICSDVAECGQGMAGCELEDGHASSSVGLERTLQYSSDGLLKLTYKGPRDDTTGNTDTNVRFKMAGTDSVMFCIYCIYSCVLQL